MNVLGILKIELKKMIHRKEVWALFTMIGIPALYSIGVSLNSSVIQYNGTNREYAFSFLNNMYTFVYMVFIYIFIISLISARTLGNEIENRSILLYTQRLPNRRKMYIAKLLACIITFAIVTLIFTVVTISMFYLFVTRREDIASSIFLKSNEFLGIIMLFLSIFIIYIFSIELSMMLSVFLKTNNTVILFIIVTVICMYMSNFPYVRNLTLNYYMNEIGKLDYDNVKEIANLFTKGFLVFIGYSVIFNWIGIERFKRRDL